MIMKKIFVAILTIIPPNKLLSAIFLFCFNFQIALMSLKVRENVVSVSNSLDPDEMPSSGCQVKFGP